MISKLIIPPKEGKHEKPMPALQSCHTLGLWLMTAFSEGEVSLVIAEQGMGTFRTWIQKHFGCSLGIYLYILDSCEVLPGADGVL